MKSSFASFALFFSLILFFGTHVQASTEDEEYFQLEFRDTTHDQDDLSDLYLNAVHNPKKTEEGFFAGPINGPPGSNKKFSIQFKEHELAGNGFIAKLREYPSIATEELPSIADYESELPISILQITYRGSRRANKATVNKKPSFYFQYLQYRNHLSQKIDLDIDHDHTAKNLTYLLNNASDNDMIPNATAVLEALLWLAENQQAFNEIKIKKLKGIFQKHNRKNQRLFLSKSELKYTEYAKDISFGELRNNHLFLPASPLDESLTESLQVRRFQHVSLDRNLSEFSFFSRNDLAVLGWLSEPFLIMEPATTKVSPGGELTTGNYHTVQITKKRRQVSFSLFYHRGERDIQSIYASSHTSPRRVLTISNRDITLSSQSRKSIFPQNTGKKSPISKVDIKDLPDQINFIQALRILSDRKLFQRRPSTLEKDDITKLFNKPEIYTPSLSEQFILPQSTAIPWARTATVGFNHKHGNFHTYIHIDLANPYIFSLSPVYLLNEHAQHTPYIIQIKKLSPVKISLTLLPNSENHRRYIHTMIGPELYKRSQTTPPENLVTIEVQIRHQELSIKGQYRDAPPQTRTAPLLRWNKRRWNKQSYLSLVPLPGHSNTFLPDLGAAISLLGFMLQQHDLNSVREEYLQALLAPQPRQNEGLGSTAIGSFPAAVHRDYQIIPHYRPNKTHRAIAYGVKTGARTIAKALTSEKVLQAVKHSLPAVAVVAGAYYGYRQSAGPQMQDQLLNTIIDASSGK